MKRYAMKRNRPILESLERRALLAGSLDTSLGGTGTVIGRSGVDTAVMIQPADGKIVTAGYAPDSTGADHFALARYNANGTADTSFGTNGQVLTTVNSDGGVIHGAALESDGRIVAVGEVYVKVKNSPSGLDKVEFAVARYTTTGALDTTFGGVKNKNGSVSNAGEVFLSFGTGKDVATGVAFETINGATKIVVAGWTNSPGHPEAVVARFNLNGTPDTSFGGGTGRVIVSLASMFSSQVQTVAVQPDGRIVVAGKGAVNSGSANAAFVARFNTDGSLDSTFGTNGVVVSQFTAQDEFYALAIQPDGKVLAAGLSAVVVNGGGHTYGDVVRYNANGTLDTTFAGGTGIAAGPSEGSYYNGLALQSNGQIVAVGSGPNTTGLVSRFNVDGSPDSTYGSGGSVLTALGVVTQYNAVVIQPSDGNAVAVGYASAAWPNQNQLVARYTATDPLAAAQLAVVISSPSPDPLATGDTALGETFRPSKRHDTL